jgi:hypothetical protein
LAVLWKDAAGLLIISKLISVVNFRCFIPARDSPLMQLLMNRISAGATSPQLTADDAILKILICRELISLRQLSLLLTLRYALTKSLLWCDWSIHVIIMHIPGSITMCGLTIVGISSRASCHARKL